MKLKFSRLGETGRKRERDGDDGGIFSISSNDIREGLPIFSLASRSEARVGNDMRRVCENVYGATPLRPVSTVLGFSVPLFVRSQYIP